MVSYRSSLSWSKVRPKVLSSSLLFVVLTAIKEPSLFLSLTCYLTHSLILSRLFSQSLIFSLTPTPHWLTGYITFTDRQTASLNLIDWLTTLYWLTDKPLHSTSLTDWLHYIDWQTNRFTQPHWLNNYIILTDRQTASLNLIDWQINCLTHPHRLTGYIILTDRRTASLTLIDWLATLNWLTDKLLHSPIDPPTTLTTFFAPMASLVIMICNLTESRIVTCITKK